MAKLVFAVFEPFKYSWKIFPVQILIQARTWGKATHVGMLWNTEDVYNFLEYIKDNNNEIERKEALEKFKHAGVLVSATWPKVKFQNIFKDYVGDNIFLKEIEITGEQENLIRLYWNKRLNKEGYSLIGLTWFVAGPIIDIFRKSRYKAEPDPNKEFCSEATTNALYFAGIKVFSFMSHPIEDLILLARKERRYTSFIEKLTKTDIETIKKFGYKNSKDFFKDALEKFYFGYKISPRVFKINPIFKDLGVLKVKKKRIYLN